jgi:hypothetical protein
MIHARAILCAAAMLVTLASCAHRLDTSASQHVLQPSQDKTMDSREFFDQNMTVTWELRYYVVGDFPLQRSDSLLFLKGPDAEHTGGVVGFVMEIVEPAEYAGRVLAAHFDTALLTDGFQFYTMGRRYTEEVPRSAIGQLRFGICR